jgi:hypothetical protein
MKCERRGTYGGRATMPGTASAASMAVTVAEATTTISGCRGHLGLSGGGVGGREYGGDVGDGH